MMHKRKAPNSQQYDWGIDLHCPSCGSTHIVKVETKGSDHCEDCHHHDILESAKKLRQVDTKLSVRLEDMCEASACSNSQAWVTRNSIRQEFRCQDCRHRWSEIRRIL